MPVEIPVNVWAILSCGVMSLVLGFAWFGPLFGKKYMQYLGVTEEDTKRFLADPKARRQMNINYVLSFVIACITAFVLVHVIVFGNAYTQMSGLSGGLQGAAWVWLGFYVPSIVGGVLWEIKKWGWFALVASYYLVQILLMG